MNINRFRDALVDIVDNAYYIDGSGRSDAARRFVDAVQDACKQLADMPGMGVLRDYGNPANAGMRMWPVPAFPRYLIFYKVAGSELQILRVLHGSRDLAAIFGPVDE